MGAKERGSSDFYGCAEPVPFLDIPEMVFVGDVKGRCHNRCKVSTKRG